MNEKIQHLINQLSKRNMNGYFVQNKIEAEQKALEMIPSMSTVGFGGSVTLEQIGILDTLRSKGNVTLLDRTILKNPVALHQLYVQMFGCDVFLSGSNAITENGQIVNVDGRGNRVAMITYGPKKIIIIIGKNKITKDLDSAMIRIKTVACPLNLKRIRELSKQKGKDANQEWSLETIWGQVSIIERQLKQDQKRIHVIIVDEELGF
jgi:L-lactate utilization protein LutB